MNLIELEKVYGFDEGAVKVILEQFKIVDAEIHNLETLIQNDSCSQESWFYNDILDKHRNAISSMDRRFQQMLNNLQTHRYTEQYTQEE